MDVDSLHSPNSPPHEADPKPYKSGRTGEKVKDTMSIFSTITSDIQKFFGALATDAEKFWNAFTKLFGKAPTALQTLDNFITESAPMVIAISALVVPAEEPLIAAGISMVEESLAAIKAAVDAAASGSSVQDYLTALENNIASLLPAAGIKDPALQQKIEKFVTFVVDECKVLIPAVESWVKKIATKP